MTQRMVGDRDNGLEATAGINHGVGRRGAPAEERVSGLGESNPVWTDPGPAAAQRCREENARRNRQEAREKSASGGRERC